MPIETAAAAGVTRILAGRASAFLYVPPGYRGDRPMPLLVMLHGAGGDRYSDIIAFAPGFAAPDLIAGMPAVFVSHGLQDRMLPIETRSRRIVPRLRRAGYAVRYEEFAGGHAVPGTLAREALQAFVRRPQAKQKIAA